MQLIDGQRYRLPDGVIVIAVEQTPGYFRLESAYDIPLYLQDSSAPNVVWQRVIYVNDVYSVVPCDLTNEDVTSVGEATQ